MKRLIALLILVALVGGAVYYAWSHRSSPLHEPKAAFRSVGETIREAKLTGKVKVAFELNRELERYSVHVDARDDGVVVLTGEVPREELRRAAEKLAAAVPDVRKVVNDLRVSPDLPAPSEPGRTLGESIDDRSLEAKVHVAFSLNRGLKGTDLKVKAFRKEVTLSGEVSTEAQRQLAVEIAQGTPNVVKVNDEVRIRGQEAPSQGVQDVERALAANPNIAPYRLKVREDGGRLVLTGRVKTGAEKDLAGLLARDAAGKPVENALVVGPDR